MNEDYLWDRSGPRDPEIARLERALAPLRYRHGGAAFGAPARPRSRWRALAAAAALAVAAGALMGRGPAARPAVWRVESIAGPARLGNRQAAIAMPLRAGQVLQTGGDTRMTLRADPLGTIEVGPDSELRAATNRRVELAHGVLEAYIWAPPRQFVVDTPSARAVDLGCRYTITADPSGNGLLRVSLGWVAFEYGGRESFIPAGADCATRKGHGPGIPYYEDASEELRAALAAFETGDGAALERILAAARPDDGITLWHLLTRVEPKDRGRVFDRFRDLIVVPKEVTREAVVRQDRHAIDLCWNALNLQNTDWWRGWEARWGW